eukprot:1897685-Prymnesium_polylepis.1
MRRRAVPRRAAVDGEARQRSEAGEGGARAEGGRDQDAAAGDEEAANDQPGAAQLGGPLLEARVQESAGARLRALHAPPGHMRRRGGDGLCHSAGCGGVGQHAHATGTRRAARQTRRLARGTEMRASGLAGARARAAGGGDASGVD